MTDLWKLAATTAAAAGWGWLHVARPGVGQSSSRDEAQTHWWQAGRIRPVAMRVWKDLEMTLCRQCEPGQRWTAVWQVPGPGEEDMQKPAPGSGWKLWDWTRDSSWPLRAGPGSGRRVGRLGVHGPAANALHGLAKDTDYTDSMKSWTIAHKNILNYVNIHSVSAHQWTTPFHVSQLKIKFSEKLKGKFTAILWPPE